MPILATIGAVVAAWWLRGILTIAVLILAWNFLVPPGSLGKPEQPVVRVPLPSVGAGQPPLGATGPVQPRVAVSPVPAAPAVTAVPVVASELCRAVHDYGLDAKPEISTSGMFLRVQYWTDGQPERETFLPASAAGGGRFILTRALRGHVWEFDGTCTDADMKADVDGSITRRKLGGANNAGYVEWKETGLFQPAVPR